MDFFSRTKQGAPRMDCNDEQLPKTVGRLEALVGKLIRKVGELEDRVNELEEQQSEHTQPQRAVISAEQASQLKPYSASAWDFSAVLDSFVQKKVQTLNKRDRKAKNSRNNENLLRLDPEATEELDLMTCPLTLCIHCFHHGRDPDKCIFFAPYYVELHRGGKDCQQPLPRVESNSDKKCANKTKAVRDLELHKEGTDYYCIRFPGFYDLVTFKVAKHFERDAVASKQEGHPGWVVDSPSTFQLHWNEEWPGDYNYYEWLRDWLLNYPDTPARAAVLQEGYRERDAVEQLKREETHRKSLARYQSAPSSSDEESMLFLHVVLIDFKIT